MSDDKYLRLIRLWNLLNIYISKSRDMIYRKESSFNFSDFVYDMMYIWDDLKVENQFIIKIGI